MSEKETVERLKAELEARRKLGPRGRFTEPLRMQVLEYARARQAQGDTLEQVARQLGLSGWTLSRWSGRARREQAGAAQAVNPSGAESGFHPVEVRQEAVAAGSLVVHGPRGVRIEGLSLEGLVALVRGLQS